MPIKLGKWYIVNLENKRVAVDCHYNRFWNAVETERARGRRHFTALTGRHILEHAGRPWIIDELGDKEETDGNYKN